MLLGSKACNRSPCRLNEAERIYLGRTTCQCKVRSRSRQGTSENEKSLHQLYARHPATRRRQTYPTEPSLARPGLLARVATHPRKVQHCGINLVAGNETALYAHYCPADFSTLSRLSSACDGTANRIITATFDPRFAKTRRVPEAAHER